MTLNITAYIRPTGMVRPTGVGKHQINMINALAKRQGTRISIIAPSDTDITLLKHYHPNILFTIMPYPRRIAEFLWTRTDFPWVDRYISGSNPWLYFPFEMSVKSRKARIISTFHCVNWFEKDLPWHEDPSTAKARKSLKPVFDKCLARSDVVASVSGFLKERICALFAADPSKIAVIGNGVEDIYFAKPRETVNKSSPPRIMVLAPLTLRKGGDYLVNVAAMLATKLPSARIIVPGGSPGDPDVEKAARALKNIEIPPYSDSTELAAQLKQASVLLILSRYDTFGIPVVEAMAAGVPVIGANKAGLPEVIGEAGFTVDPEDTAAVCDLIVKIVSDSHTMSSLSEKGTARAKLFTWEACAAKLEQSIMERE